MRALSNIGADAIRVESLTVDEAVRLIQERRKWLRKDDKLTLCEKHSMSLSTVNMQLAGKVKRFNVRLIIDALDIANKTQADIRARI